MSALGEDDVEFSIAVHVADADIRGRFRFLLEKNYAVERRKRVRDHDGQDSERETDGHGLPR
jgi:hypothetical protein